MNATIWGRRSAVIGSVGVLVGLSLAGTPSAPPATVVAMPQDTTERRECPMPFMIKDSLVSLNVIPLAGPITNVPEFHDCQRFIIDSQGTLVYGTLYAIFAAFDLDTLFVDTLEGVPEGKPFAAAQIVSWGGTYKPLGIGPWFNCLLLFGHPTAPSAKMVRLGATQHDCLAYTGGGPETPLDVRRLRVGGVDEDIPAVARWEWDARAKKQYIGIKCGRAWCEIYERGATLTSAASYGGSRETAIKGWFDEQVLAVGGVAVSVSTIKGTIFPHPKLGAYTLETFRRWTWWFRRPWVPTAYVALSDGSQPDLATYLGKMGFEGAAATAPVNVGLLNQISLCNGSRFQCKVPANLTCTWPTTGVPSDSLWWARMRSPSGGERFKCVKRHDHSDLTEQGIHIPGTARWRWLANDETEWMRCAQGCCEPH